MNGPRKIAVHDYAGLFRYSTPFKGIDSQVFIGLQPESLQGDLFMGFVTVSCLNILL